MGTKRKAVEMAAHRVLPYQQDQKSPQGGQVKQENLLRRAQWAVGMAAGSNWATARCATPSGAHLSDKSNNINTSPGSALNQMLITHSTSGISASTTGEDSSWEVRAFAEDAASCSGQWPPKSYACSFCQREFRTAQALGGHMNVHRRERQANQLALFRNNAQAVAAASPEPAASTMVNTHGSHTQAPVCWLYSLPNGAVPSAMSQEAAPTFLYSNVSNTAVGAGISGTLQLTTAMNCNNKHIQAQQRISSPASHSQYNSNPETMGNGITTNIFGPQVSSSQHSTSPLSSPASQGSGSSRSGSSAITKGSHFGHQSATSTASLSKNTVNFAQKLQLGAFHPYQNFPTEDLITQELCHLPPRKSLPYTEGMMITVEEDGILDLELRLGPSY